MFSTFNLYSFVKQNDSTTKLPPKLIETRRLFLCGEIHTVVYISYIVLSIESDVPTLSRETTQTLCCKVVCCKVCCLNCTHVYVY